MTLIVMINADFSWIIRVYHNHLRHLRSIVLVVYFLRVSADARYHWTASDADGVKTDGYTAGGYLGIGF